MRWQLRKSSSRQESRSRSVGRYDMRCSTTRRSAHVHPTIRHIAGQVGLPRPAARYCIRWRSQGLPALSSHFAKRGSHATRSRRFALKPGSRRIARWSTRSRSSLACVPGSCGAALAASPGTSRRRPGGAGPPLGRMIGGTATGRYWPCPPGGTRNGRISLGSLGGSRRIAVFLSWWARLRRQPAGNAQIRCGPRPDRLAGASRCGPAVSWGRR